MHMGNCHNTHPLSPKTDWRLGDMRGVIEVILPIDEALVEAESEAVQLSLLIALGVLVGLFAIGLTAHRVISPLRRVEERAQAIAIMVVFPPMCLWRRNGPRRQSSCRY
jgi:hypothetical protein